jgi:hypothetical protein
MQPRPTRRRRRRAASLLLAAAVLTTGCAPGAAPGGASAPVALDPDPDKPFVLTGVADVTRIAQLTGPDAINDTASVGVAGADLGSMTTVGDRTYFFFGDTFGERDPDSIGGQGGFWRSNVSAWTTDDDPSDGITFDGWAPVDDVGLAAALVEGDHAANDGMGEVTKIPTYGFAIGETLYISYMSVSFWGVPGAWDANYAGLAKSTDRGTTWTALDAPRWPGDSNFIQVATAHVRDGGEDYVYFWSIPSGRFGGVQLMRVPATEDAVEDSSAYSYFAGTDAGGAPRWSPDMDAATTIVDGTIGELSVMWSTYLERWIMTYSDGGNAYIREGITPWGPWGEPIEIAAQADYPGLYSPYLDPRYVQDGGRKMYFTLSLWDPYNVFWFSLDLEKAQ